MLVCLWDEQRHWDVELSMLWKSRWVTYHQKFGITEGCSCTSTALALAEFYTQEQVHPHTVTGLLIPLLAQYTCGCYALLWCFFYNDRISHSLEEDPSSNLNYLVPTSIWNGWVVSRQTSENPSDRGTPPRTLQNILKILPKSQNHKLSQLMFMLIFNLSSKI